MTLDMYKLTEQFPKSEVFAMVSQIRRADYSVPSNVEGKSRDTDKEFRRFLIIARASVDELSYFLLLAKDLSYIEKEQYEKYLDKCSHVASMLNNIIKKINE
ncbi:MAG: four helix bundle protein [Saprospiraceae bacterium]